MVIKDAHQDDIMIDVLNIKNNHHSSYRIKIGSVSKRNIRYLSTKDWAYCGKFHQRLPQYYFSAFSCKELKCLLQIILNLQILNEKCKVSCRSSWGISKLALPPGRPGIRLPTEMFTPWLFWDVPIFLALREQLHDFISALLAFVSPAGFIIEPMPGCF